MKYDMKRIFVPEISEISGRDIKDICVCANQTWIWKHFAIDSWLDPLCPAAMFGLCALLNVPPHMGNISPFFRLG